MTQLQRLVERFRKAHPEGKVIIHVGPGPFYPGKGQKRTFFDDPMSPFSLPFEEQADGREIGEDEFHICFEPHPQFHKEFVNLRRTWPKDKGRVLAVNGSFGGTYQDAHVGEAEDEQKARKLPVRSKELSDAIADEIHIHNVINWEGVTEKARESMVAEASRLAKPDCNIYVSSLWAPHPVSEKDLINIALQAELNTEILARNSSHRIGIPKEELDAIARHTGNWIHHQPPFGPYFLARLTKRTT